MNQLRIEERHMQARFIAAHQYYTRGQFVELADLATHAVRVGSRVWDCKNDADWETVGRMRGVANCIAEISGRAGIITKAMGFPEHAFQA